MLTYALVYLIAALLAVATLSFMILKIGTLLADCPQTGKNARSAALSVATGYAAIGTGGVLLIGGMLPLLRDMPEAGATLALGFAALCLGLGFTQAVGTLRDVLKVSDAA
ncbi:hypothetical protein KO498_08705 [Lentibacter algarum]|uniref:hypothetical protein n=1 Tax=Lentibacter algarum TaxID=576131 RepID=UPI001C07074C|nr:hypothetical protein [Lentibacter algarum]MBU2981894.1 hypothetical protein [Lentibacter algarum]